MRVIVTGSRVFDDYRMIEQALLALEANLDPKWDWADITLIHGGAAGADSMAAQVARELGWKVEAHPADWDQYGKRAGYLRNQEMLDAGADMVVAFPIGESKGTRMMIDLATKAGIPVEVWES